MFGVPRDQRRKGLEGGDSRPKDVGIAQNASQGPDVRRRRQGVGEALYRGVRRNSAEGVHGSPLERRADGVRAKREAERFESSRTRSHDRPLVDVGKILGIVYHVNSQGDAGARGWVGQTPSIRDYVRSR